jgi:hypothetical protein
MTRLEQAPSERRRSRAPVLLALVCFSLMFLASAERRLREVDFNDPGVFFKNGAGGKVTNLLAEVDPVPSTRVPRITLTPEPSPLAGPAAPAPVGAIGHPESRAPPR